MTVLNKADKVAASKARALIEEMLLQRKPESEIIVAVANKTGEAFDVDDIAEYNKQYVLQGKSLISEVLNVSHDLAKHEVPALTDADQLAQFFSFKSTNDDLELIYARIRELKKAAAENPKDDSYDGRIVKFLDQAEKIRQRVIKNQFDNLRKSILLNIGKKIVGAAVSVFLPYIGASKKDEARKKFLAAIEPLIEVEIVPPKPDDIIDIEKETNA